MAGQPVNLLFPVKGLSRNHPYALVPEGSTPAALNVRPEDALGHRFRGGRRGGLTKHSESQVDTTPVQHITVGTTVTNPGLLNSYRVTRVQQTADGQTHDTSIVVGEQEGTPYTEIQVSPDGIYDYGRKPCCYDADGNFYVCMDAVGNYTRLYKYSPSLVEQASVLVSSLTGHTGKECDVCWCPGWGLIAVILLVSDAGWEGGTEAANLFLIDPSDMSIVAHHNIDGGGSILGGSYAPGQGQLVWDAALEQLVVITGTRQTTYGGASAQPGKTVFAFDEDLTLQWSYDTAESDTHEARGGAVYDGVVYVPQCKADGAKQRLYQLDAATGALIRYKEVPAVDGRDGDSQFKCSNCCVRSDGEVVLAYCCKGAGAAEWSMELVCLEWNSGTSAWDIDWYYTKNPDRDSNAIVTEKLTMWLDSDDNVYVNETASATGDYNLWKNVADSLNVEVSMIEFTSLGTYTRYWDKNGPADSWRAYSAPSRPGWGFALYENVNTARPVSATELVFVQNGRFYNASNTEYPDATGLAPLVTRVNDVYSAWAYQNIYVVDGTNTRCLVLLESADAPWVTYYHQSVALATLVAAAGEGTAPEECRLICRYRGRLVLSAQAGDPHNWFMSAVNNPLDWDYAPAIPVATQAVAGNNADAGKVGDVVTALIPYNDDLLIFGGLHTIYQMSGDPMDGGSIDILSDQTGIKFGQAFCRDPKGYLYFMGTDGVYAMAPVEGGGTELHSITEGRLDNEFDSIDWGAYRARFVWDYHRAGLLITLVPYDSTAAVLVYYWSQQADSWWVDSYPLTMGPTALCPLAGESVADQRLLFGCRDGFIRYYNDSAETDDGTAITSYVEWMLPGTPMDVQQAIAQVQAVLGEDSAAVVMQIFRGSTAQEAAAATVPVLTRTLVAGRAMPIIHGVGGRHLRIRVYSTGNRWALEQLQLIITGVGTGGKR